VIELAREDAQADASCAVTVGQLEAELATLRTEQRRCAKLMAKLDDAPELAAEYKTRTEQIRHLERDIASAKAAPQAVELAAQAIAVEVAAAFERLREGLSGAPEAARDAVRALFPRGLRAEPDASGTAWVISGTPRIPEMSTLGDPTALCRNVSLPRFPFEIDALPLRAA
jgi:hypothetical protein